jgi:hypothetical protein
MSAAGCRKDSFRRLQERRYGGRPRNRYKLLPAGDGWQLVIFDIVKKGFDFPCHGSGMCFLST